MSYTSNTAVLKSLQINNIYALVSSDTDGAEVKAEAEAEAEVENKSAFQWAIYVPTYIDKEKGKVKGEIAYVVNE